MSIRSFTRNLHVHFWSFFAGLAIFFPGNAFAASIYDAESNPHLAKIIESLRFSSLAFCELVKVDGTKAPCIGRVLIRNSSSYNAWAKQGNIVISSALIASSSDDEIAYAIAHEIGHSIFRHSASNIHNELTADYWAGRLMIRGGFDIEKAKSVLDRGELSRILNMPFSLLSHPSCHKRMTAIRSGALQERSHLAVAM